MGYKFVMQNYFHDFNDLNVYEIRSDNWLSFDKVTCTLCISQLA